MNVLDFHNKIFQSSLSVGKLGRQIRLDSVIRHLTVKSAQLLLPFSYGKPSQMTKANDKIVVSLTSFPARIDKVWLVIESLLRQTIQPCKIILWLSKEQFDDGGNLPKKLLAQKVRGLEIRFVEDDLKSHKKYCYAFNEFADYQVVLVDDDLLYPSTFIEELAKDFSSDSVHCSYGSQILRNPDGSLLPYVQWNRIYKKYYGPDFFFGSGGGIMLQPGKLGDDTCNPDLFMKLCPTADDIWLNAQCRLAGLKIRKVRSGLIFPLSYEHENTLCSINVTGGKNDLQLQNVLSHYPSLKDKF